MKEKIAPQPQITEWEMRHMDRAAWRKAGSIPGWEPFHYEVVDIRSKHRDLIIQGGVPRFIARGKNKGAKTWRGCEIMRVVISGAEIIAEEKAFAEHTGNCPRCMGDGQVLQSWSRETGTVKKPCSSCCGTGKFVI